MVQPKEFKCRASGAGDIMTNPRSGTGLSETCKKYLRRQWVQDVYKREKDVTSNAIKKGLMNEEQGITMLSHYLGGVMLYKNERNYIGEFTMGTPDVPYEEEQIVYDVKCNYDIFTFAGCELTSGYQWQLDVYRDLLCYPNAALVYVLTDTPMPLIKAEVRRICWELQDDAEALTIERELIKQWTYPDIPLPNRIKVIHLPPYDEARMAALRKRVIECREYYNNLTL
jgi:hypothetical protein